MDWNLNTSAEPAAPRYLTLQIEEQQAGRTVDSLLRRALGLSGSGVKAAKRLPRGILLDGERVFVSCRPRAGQCLAVQISQLHPQAETADSAPPAPELPGLFCPYEDADVLVAEKPAGLAVHRGPGTGEDTLLARLAARDAARCPAAERHPVHRLDRGTGGLLLIARHAYAQSRLGCKGAGGLFRGYLALCTGRFSQTAGMVDAPIARLPGDLLRRRIDPAGAAARTQYRVLAESADFSLVALRLHSGRTHQIRVHMAALGHPVVGDFLYGEERADFPLCFALHSAALGFVQPVTGEEKEFFSRPRWPALPFALPELSREVFL